jgi:hypothetical protein
MPYQRPRSRCESAAIIVARELCADAGRNMTARTAMWDRCKEERILVFSIRSKKFFRAASEDFANWRETVPSVP